MTRLMGDATHAEVPLLATAQPGLDLVAGYVTGDPSIRWTAPDWVLFGSRVPPPEFVTIDQGFTGSPVPTADVRDVETGAWGPWNAIHTQPWTAARPTIYCNQSTLPQVLADGWQGDLWLAIVGWQPGQPLPAAPGCTIVAVQNDFRAAYDLSQVLDPTWPLGDPMTTVQTQPGWASCNKCSVLFYGQGGPAGVCPAGGQHTPPPAGADYSLLFAG